MTESFLWFVGIDWASEAHAVCLLDAPGTVGEECTVTHTIDAVNAWVAGVLERTGAAPSDIAVAIETPRGVLVDTLVERRFGVFAINPKQLDRFRDRFTSAGAKDDRRDARVLGDALRTDRQAFRRVQLEDPLVLELRELTRAEGEGQRDLGRFTNRIREQVARIAPALLTLCPAADEPWFWTLLETAATPTARPRLTRTDVRALLKRHRIRRLTADVGWTQVQAADFVPAPGVIAGVHARLDGLIEQVRVAQARRRRCLKEMDRVLEALTTREPSEKEPREHRDVEILASLPGVGRLVTATMRTEAAQPLADRDYLTLRACAGTAPVTERSGKRSRLVKMRRACNQRLREAVYHWGRSSVRWDPATRAYDTRLRQRGHTHGRAIRAVLDRWFRILIAMLKHRTLYDPERVSSSLVAVTPTA
jgi:transposase